nr:DksA/TraR family C4-type zinc finger protein [Phaeobacter piscinae]
MASGWAPDGAVQDQIDATILDAVSAILSRLHSGEAAEECEFFGEGIPMARHEAMRGVKTCVPCQSTRESSALCPGTNRRGNKGGQLR